MHDLRRINAHQRIPHSRPHKHHHPLKHYSSDLPSPPFSFYHVQYLHNIFITASIATASNKKSTEPVRYQEPSQPKRCHLSPSSWRVNRPTSPLSLPWGRFSSSLLSYLLQIHCLLSLLPPRRFTFPLTELFYTAVRPVICQARNKPDAADHYNDITPWLHECGFPQHSESKHLHLLRTLCTVPNCPVAATRTLCEVVDAGSMISRQTRRQITALESEAPKRKRNTRPQLSRLLSAAVD